MVLSVAFLRESSLELDFKNFISEPVPVVSLPQTTRGNGGGGTAPPPENLAHFCNTHKPGPGRMELPS
jgi:hypothetical protein